MTRYESNFHDLYFSNFLMSYQTNKSNFKFKTLDPNMEVGQWKKRKVKGSGVSLLLEKRVEKKKKKKCVQII